MEEGDGAEPDELLQAVSERAMAPVMIIAIIFFMVIFFLSYLKYKFAAQTKIKFIFFI
ncbi:hypothetical protein HMPREF9475_02052 [[Clostridium] symbiosum WAL-14673]|nr:hypothetical protein HMPREF9475_02052 [[Clostridium] symbiosum WAL-14673]